MCEKVNVCVYGYHWANWRMRNMEIEWCTLN